MKTTPKHLHGNNFKKCLLTIIPRETESAFAENLTYQGLFCWKHQPSPTKPNSKHKKRKSNSSGATNSMALCKLVKENDHFLTSSFIKPKYEN